MTFSHKTQSIFFQKSIENTEIFNAKIDFSWLKRLNNDNK